MRKLTQILIITLANLLISLSIFAQNPELWSMTKQGGTYDLGTIFKTDINGNNHNVEYSFIKYEGKHPFSGHLCETDNGKFYGMLNEGGTNNYGVLFEYDPATDTYVKKIDFDGINKGRNPNGNLMLASNGKLYGMTKYGGTNSYGVLFEYDPATDTYVKKFDFGSDNNGSTPYGNLIQASNGKLYGMTYYGGTNTYGVLFEYDPATDTYLKKFDFDGFDNGRYPRGSLMQASNGKLYGMTNSGGTNTYGVLFEYDPATDTYVKKMDFGGDNDGERPYGSLMQASNGKLYGMTKYGGTNYEGVIFEYDPATDSYVKKLDFDGSNNGSNPYGSFMQADNEKLYGMTYDGGSNDYGVLFEYDPATNIYVKKLDFNGANNGKWPFGSLMQASNNKLYGMTSAGGTNAWGGLFEYDIATDAYVKELDFGIADNGSYPKGSLMLVSRPESLTNDFGNLI